MIKIRLSRVIIRFASNIFIWATILTIITSFFISTLFPKFKVKIVSTNSGKYDNGVFYSDLFHDGNSERIAVVTGDFGCFKIYENNISKCIIDVKRKLLDENHIPLVVDYDHNGIEEIFFPTIAMDSVFINIAVFEKNYKYQVHEKFVCTIDKNRKGGYDINALMPDKGMDINNDGKIDAYFVLKSGYSYQPRKIFCYDAANDTVYQSPDNGAYLTNMYMAQNPVNKQGIIFSNNWSLGNYNSRYANIPFPDTLNWVMIFDKQLNFLFQPKPKSCYAGFLQVAPVLRNDSLYIMALSSGSDSTKLLKVSVYDLKGKPISEITMKDLNYNKLHFSHNTCFDPLQPTPFADQDGNLYLFDKDFKTFRKKNYMKSNYDECFDLEQFDLDNDGNLEKILFYETGLAIVRNDLSDVCYLDIYFPDFSFFSPVFKTGESTCFSLFLNKSCFIINYEKNQFYYWQYALYVSIFLVILILLYVFQKLRTYQLELENLKLNQIIKERTSEIRSQKEEIQVQAENLVQLDTFKQKMISMIVHDLKNPLSMILHGSEKASVKNAAQEMNILVENMLDINKFEQAKLKLHIETQLLNNIIQEAYKKVEYLFDIKNLEFKNQVGDTISVLCDAMIVERVFINLFSNAAKFTPNNGTVRVYTEIWGNSKMIITVADNGRGIEKDFLNRIFGQYESQHGKSSNIIHSTGLGLTFCQLAVEAHDGKIGVESEINKGTKISFSLDFENNTETHPFLKTTEIKIQLTPEERNYLSHYHNVLKNTELYEITELRKILKQIETDENINEDWKENLNNAVKSYNTEFYNCLIEMIRPLF